MSHRFLTILLILGTTATASLGAQSNPSFELYGNSYNMTNGYYPILVSGDFNNDGKPDMVQCCNNNGLVFFPGNGDGTFSTPVQAYPEPATALGLVAADLNGDGNLDLVGVATLNPPPPSETGNYSLMVWLGKGDGTFQTPQIYAITTYGQASAVVGNFFSDGHPDIAVAEDSSQIQLFRNQGNGTFTLAKSIPVPAPVYQPSTLVVGDLNNNGISDLALTADPGRTYVLWNDGHGNFTTQQVGTYSYPVLAISRLNGAGPMDLLVTYSCASPGAVCVGFDAYYGQGNNKLLKKTLVTTPSAAIAGNFQQIGGVDVNGDGYGDIVAISNAVCTTADCSGTGGVGLLVWLGNADGSFQQTAQAFVVAQGQLGESTMADFNRDGMMDFAVTMPGESPGGNTQFFINSTARTNCGTYTVNATATVCQPVDNTYSPSPVRVEASAYNTSGVTALQEYVDNKLAYSKSASSFNVTLPESLGPHFFVTKAWSHGASFFSSYRNITVYNGTPGPVCPAAPNSASICLPSAATINSPVLILANGNTGTSPPTDAQLYIDNKLVVNNQSGPCYQHSCLAAWSYVQTTQNLSAGSHHLVFKVWDGAGKTYEAQKTVTVN